MNKHLALGSAGEQLAAQWLQQKGYTILQQNFRWGKTEIDIVATKGEWLHIVEVKTSSTDKWGTPEMRVDQKKNEDATASGKFFTVVNGQTVDTVRCDSHHLEHGPGTPNRTDRRLEL
jgi:putative endonuclease